MSNAAKVPAEDVPPPAPGLEQDVLAVIAQAEEQNDMPEHQQVVAVNAILPGPRGRGQAVMWVKTDPYESGIYNI